MMASDSSQPEPAPPPPRCAHCGLDVPPALIIEGAPQQFCCDGCKTVFQLLNDAGLEDYYRIRETLGETDGPVEETRTDFVGLDAPSFQQAHVRQTSRGTVQVDLYLEGVHCAACVWLVEKLPNLSEGCVSAHLDYGRSRATVEWDPQTTQLSRIARSLASLGYRPHPWRGANIRAQRQQEDRRLWIRIGVAAAVALNVMFLAIALYAGERQGMDAGLMNTLRWTSLAVFFPSVSWCALPFFSGALASLRARVLHMDLPLSLGIAIGFVASAHRTVLGQGDIYFDSLAVLILLLLVARWLQRRGHRVAQDAAELLHALTPSSALKVTDEGVESVPLEALEPGMQVEVRSGDSVPADGRVSSGRSLVDTSILSGESHPTPVRPGDKVFAGTVNLQTPLRLILEATGEDTRVGRLMRLMEDAAARRAPIVQLADRLTGYFVTIVLVAAVLTGLGWFQVDPDRALENVIALLIVTCPCALGMATPVALTVAIGRAARRGILIKGGDTVERMARSRHLLLDKTGTLTAGRLELLSWHGDEEACALLVSLEAASAHPLARAVADGLRDVVPLPVDSVQEVLGSGLTARHRGRKVVMGASSFVFREGGRWAGREQQRAYENDREDERGDERGDERRDERRDERWDGRGLGQVDAGEHRYNQRYVQQDMQKDVHLHVAPEKLEQAVVTVLDSPEDGHAHVARAKLEQEAEIACLSAPPESGRDHALESRPLSFQGSIGPVHLETILEAGLTPVLISVAGVIRGVAGFGDPLRAEAPGLIATLRARGWTVGILSGDHPAVVAAVGRQLGVAADAALGGLSPEEKLEHVQDAVAVAPTIMVGDGVNDAAALSAATVGVSVHGGAEASLAAADLFLTRPGLAPLMEVIEGSQATLRVIRRNLIFSLGYNLVGATLAMMGLMGPLLAAILMPFSSLTVVVSSLMGGGFRTGSEEP